MVSSHGTERSVHSGKDNALKALKIEISSVAGVTSPMKIKIPKSSQHKRTWSHPPPLPLGPLRADNPWEAGRTLIPVGNTFPTVAERKIDYCISEACNISFAPLIENRPEHNDLDYWKRQAVNFKRQNLALQVRCQLVEKSFSNAKNMISNLILLYQGSESSDPDFILEMGSKLRVAPDMGNLSVVQDLLRKTNAIAEKILLYNFELQKNLNDLKEDNKMLRRTNEALKQNQYSNTGNRVTSFEVPRTSPSMRIMHERAVSNAFRPNGSSNTPIGMVGAVGVFGGIHSKPEQTILAPSEKVVSNAILPSGYPKTSSQPSRNIQEVLEAGSSIHKKSENWWREVVSNMREEISVTNEKVLKLERRVRMMVEAKYEMIENFSLELERLRTSRSRS